MPQLLAHCLCMNKELRPHSPLAAHSAHRVDISLQGSTGDPVPGAAPSASFDPPVIKPPGAASEVAASFDEVVTGTDSSSRRPPFSSREVSVATGPGDDRVSDTAKKHMAPRKIMTLALAAAPRRELLALGEVVGRIMQSSELELFTRRSNDAISRTVG